MISSSQLIIKRVFDLILSLFLLPLLLFPILILIVIATVDTKHWGLFSQTRVGQHGSLFKIYKIRTLKNEVHTLGRLEKSASNIGRIIRNYKLDELPQIFNVILGQMSFVGPRPDIVGFADELKGENRVILKLKPGITGPATLKYKDEESILALQDDPETYNRTIIWVDKVKINKNYMENWSFYLDLSCIIKSLAY